MTEPTKSPHPPAALLPRRGGVCPAGRRAGAVPRLLGVGLLLMVTAAGAGSPLARPSASQPQTYLRAQAEQLGVPLHRAAEAELVALLRAQGWSVPREVDLAMAMALRLSLQAEPERRLTLARHRDTARRALLRRYCRDDAEAAVWLRHYPALRPPHAPACTAGSI